MKKEQVLVITAADIREGEYQPSRLAAWLLEHIAMARTLNGGRALLIRIDFPVKVGGLEMRVRRSWLPWQWHRLAWWWR